MNFSMVISFSVDAQLKIQADGGLQYRKPQTKVTGQLAEGVVKSQFLSQRTAFNMTGQLILSIKIKITFTSTAP
jgi:hypothetical protein